LIKLTFFTSIIGIFSLDVIPKYEGTKWKFMGLIPMFDPPRDDTKETIQRIRELGVQIKMITGDQVSVLRSFYDVLKSNQIVSTTILSQSLFFSCVFVVWSALYYCVDSE
jgi:H+-transporting ATPase